MSKSFIVTPKPLDFDAFIPWICVQFEVPYNIVVVRVVQEDYLSHQKLQSSITKSKLHLKHTTKHKIDDSLSPEVSKKSSIKIAMKSTSNPKNAIIVTAYYDTKARLVEIAIIGSQYEIPRKVIISFSFCVPFHPLLTRISIRKRGLKLPALYEISKLLSHSNITDVIFEDCYVPEGAYYLLLDRVSHLKNLVLRRLCINNIVCMKLAKRLDIDEPASNTLITLDLSSNNITDDGAKALGDILRRNRHLLHLNLGNNKISDIGAAYILNSLNAFPLSFEEIRDKKFRRFEYFIRKIVVFKKHLELLTHRRQEKNSSEVMETKDKKTSKRLQPSVTKSELTISQLAEKLTQEEIGDFWDVFSYDNVGYINKIMHCNGNLHLCSLNLSYNNISYLTVCKILKVLLYQRNFLCIRKSTSTGLLRILFEGNNVPHHCKEMNSISELLNKSIIEQSSSKHISLRSHSSNSMSVVKSAKHIRVKNKH